MTVTYQQAAGDPAEAQSAVLAHHAELQRVLDEWAGALVAATASDAPADRPRRLLRAFLADEVLQHAEAEERTLRRGDQVCARRSDGEGELPAAARPRGFTRRSGGSPRQRRPPGGQPMSEPTPGPGGWVRPRPAAGPSCQPPCRRQTRRAAWQIAAAAWPKPNLRDLERLYLMADLGGRRYSVLGVLATWCCPAGRRRPPQRSIGAQIGITLPRSLGLSGYIFSVLYGISPGHEPFWATRRRKSSLSAPAGSAVGWEPGRPAVTPAAHVAARTRFQPLSQRESRLPRSYGSARRAG